MMTMLESFSEACGHAKTEQVDHLYQNSSSPSERGFALVLYIWVRSFHGNATIIIKSSAN